MADTPNYNLPYPDDYTQLADVPAAVKALAEATDDALGEKAATSELPTKTSDLTNDSDFTTKAYVDGLIGDINNALDLINGESI